MLKSIGIPVIVAVVLAAGSSVLLAAAWHEAPATVAADGPTASGASQARSDPTEQARPAHVAASAENPEAALFLPDSFEVPVWLTELWLRLKAARASREILIWVGVSSLLSLVVGVPLWRRRRVSVTETQARPLGAGQQRDATAAPTRGYFRKMLGTTRGSPPRVSWSEILWSWVGAFLGIGGVALLNQLYFAGTDLNLVIGSLGASAVLAYGAPRSPLAQPRNLVGGHVLSALVGVAAWKLLQQDPVLAEALAVATAIAVMHATKTLHPPGGATALIAVIGSKQVHDLGFFYCLVPATLSPLILLVVALLVNNIPPSRRYPENWY